MGYTGSVKIPSTKDIEDMIDDILGDEQAISEPESDEVKQKQLEKKGRNGSAGPSSFNGAATLSLRKH